MLFESLKSIREEFGIFGGYLEGFEIELIKMLEEGQNYHFIKLKIKIIFSRSLESIREEFETFGGNLERFRNQKIKKNMFG